MAGGRRSYDTVPCLPHAKGTVVFVFLAKLRTAQINCRLECAQCALFLMSITDTFPLSSGNGFRNSPDKYAGIVTWKYPFTRVNSHRINHIIEARSITSSLLSRMEQLIVSHSCSSKAAKIFKKSAIFKHSKVSPSKPCVVEHVTSNSGKRSDAFHSTSENSKNLNRWFLLNGKRPTIFFDGASSEVLTAVL